MYDNLFQQEYHCFVEMIGICNVMQVPAASDREHWPVNKFQHILAHFSDQVKYLILFISVHMSMHMIISL